MGILRWKSGWPSNILLSGSFKSDWKIVFLLVAKWRTSCCPHTTELHHVYIIKFWIAWDFGLSYRTFQKYMFYYSYILNHAHFSMWWMKNVCSHTDKPAMLDLWLESEDRISWVHYYDLEWGVSVNFQCGCVLTVWLICFCFMMSSL